MTTTIKSFELTDQNTGGTFGLGKMPDVTYEQLVRTFGEPNYGASGDDKVQVEWAVKFINEFDEEILATIYDWKHYGTRPEDVTYWSVGGYKQEAFWLVKDALGMK
jgi:hypothetical protein